MGTLVLDRLVLGAPVEWREPVGSDVDLVGGTPVPADRSGMKIDLALQTLAATNDSPTERSRIRRQLRSLLNNRRYCLTGLYVAWDDDPEQNGWYVPMASDLEPIVNSISAKALKVSASWYLRGRRRTHRRGVGVTLVDRRLATTARDILERVYSTDFAAVAGYSAVALSWLPSSISDPTIDGFASVSLTGSRVGYGSSQLQAVIASTHRAVVNFDQAEAMRSLGDVVIYDRRGTITAPTTGPDAAWEEVYGEDWESSGWLTAADTPVLDNSLVRVRWLSTNTPGFAIDRWSGSAWVEQGKVLIERVGTATGYCDTLVSANVIEWAPDRAVVRCVMRRAADSFSREEVYITLQRGWTGPRFEVYPAPKTGGTAAGAGVHLFRFDAPAGTETANKYDASLQTTTGVPNFTAGAVGAATFTGQNWICMRRTTVNALILAGLQAGASGRVEASTSAYGSARNGISIRSAATAAYVSAQVGTNVANTTDAIDSVNGLYDGARDLGKEVLYDSRSPQTIVAR